MAPFCILDDLWIPIAWPRPWSKNQHASLELSNPDHFGANTRVEISTAKPDATGWYCDSNEWTYEGSPGRLQLVNESLGGERKQRNSEALVHVVGYTIQDSATLRV